MAVVLVVCCAVLGALVGALTPRVAYRLSVEHGSPSRSACAHCARPFPAGLAGWVRLEARCPGCGTRLGPSPVLTALVGAVSFGTLAWALGPVPALPAYLFVAGLGLVLAFVDLACLRLPDPLVLAAFVVGGCWLTTLAFVDGAVPALGRAALAALVSAGAYLVLALLPGSNLGLGDVKLAGLLGLMLGWLGWPTAVLGLVLPHLINGPVALALLVSRRAGRKTDMPLGPALLAGALLAVVAATRALP
jgi:leader peptidase (prepilin peptidase)/N-methyltransferase